MFGEFSSFVDEHQHVMSQRCLQKNHVLSIISPMVIKTSVHRLIPASPFTFFICLKNFAIVFKD